MSVCLLLDIKYQLLRDAKKCVSGTEKRKDCFEQMKKPKFRELKSLPSC